MSEDLVARAEDAQRTKNPLVTGARVAPLDPQSLARDEIHDHESAASWTKATALSLDYAGPAVAE